MAPLPDTLPSRPRIARLRRGALAPTLLVLAAALGACDSTDPTPAAKGPVTAPLPDLLIGEAEGVSGLTPVPAAALEDTRKAAEDGLAMFDIRPPECADIVRQQQGALADGTTMASSRGTSGTLVVALSPAGSPLLDGSWATRCPRYELVGKGASSAMVTATNTAVDAPSVEGAESTSGMRYRSESALSGVTESVSYTALVRGVSVMVTSGDANALTPESEKLAADAFRTQVEKVANS